MDPAAAVGAGAGAVPGAAVAVPAGAAAPAPAAAPGLLARADAARQAWTQKARMAWAAALFLLGCAAAALAFFALTLPYLAGDWLILGTCAPTDAEVGSLGAASEQLLLAASAQVLGATVALFVPARLVAVSGCLLGGLTAYRADEVIWQLVACHDHVHGRFSFHYWVFSVMLGAALLVGLIVSVIRDHYVPTSSCSPY